jgi:hypothetical protein
MDFGAVPGGEGLVHGLGVGHPDVFAGEAHEPAGDVQRVLSAVEHAGEPIQGRVGV